MDRILLSFIVITGAIPRSTQQLLYDEKLAGTDNRMDRDYRIFSQLKDVMIGKLSVIESIMEENCEKRQHSLIGSIQNEMSRIDQEMSNLKENISNEKSGYMDFVRKEINVIKSKNERLESNISELMNYESTKNEEKLKQLKSIMTTFTNEKMNSINEKVNLRKIFEILVNVRITAGGSTYGRVEVYYDGSWGTVCDDGWGNDDARVVCRMLGRSGGTAVGSAQYGAGSGQIWLDDVNCSGTESSLMECSKPPFGLHNCGHSEDAGVSCN